MALEELIGRVCYEDSGELEVLNEAKYCKITYKEIKFYKNTRSGDALEIPEGTEKIKYKRNNSEINIKFIKGKHTIGTYTKKLDLVLIDRKPIEKGKAIRIPVNATHYSCKNGNVLFYLAFKKSEDLGKIPEGAVWIRFDDFEKNGAHYRYGNPTFEYS